MVNVAPAPRVLVTATAPPCASASLRTIDRPSPLPPVRRLRLLSARQKRSKTLVSWSAGMPSPVSPESVGMIARVGPVTQVSAVANVHAVVRRSDLVDPFDGSGLTVLAGRTDLLAAVNGRVASGRFLTAATARTAATSACNS